MPLRSNRITIGKALRAALGIADHGTVLILVDADLGTVTLTAASQLDDVIKDTLEQLRGRATDDLDGPVR